MSVTDAAASEARGDNLPSAPLQIVVLIHTAAAKVCFKCAKCSTPKRSKVLLVQLYLTLLYRGGRGRQVGLTGRQEGTLPRHLVNRCRHVVRKLLVSQGLNH